MVATTSLTDAQRRLLNVLFDCRRPPLTKTALADADCDLADARVLARDKLIEADNDDGVVDIGVGAGIGANEEIWLHLTIKGTHWANSDPENLFLRTLDTMTRLEGKLQVRKALKVADRDRIEAVLDDGYATLHWDETLEEITSRPTRQRAFFHPSEYALVATPKIRRVLGPR